MYSEKFNFGNDVYEVVVAADNELIGSSYYANGSIFLCKDNKKYLVYSERQDTGFDKFCKQSDQRRHEIYLQIFRDYEEQVRCGNIKILTEDDIKALSVKSNIYYWFKILAIGFFLVIGFNIRSCYNEDVKTKELKTPIVIINYICVNIS